MKEDNYEIQKIFTTLAFLIGLALIDELDSSEQNALGGWFMLIGQTLSTNGSLNFKNDFKVLTGKTNGIYSNYMKVNKNNPNANDYIKNILTKTRNAIDKQINDL